MEIKVNPIINPIGVRHNPVCLLSYSHIFTKLIFKIGDKNGRKYDHPTGIEGCRYGNGDRQHRLGIFPKGDQHQNPHYPAQHWSDCSCNRRSNVGERTKKQVAALHDQHGQRLG